MKKILFAVVLALCLFACQSRIAPVATENKTPKLLAFVDSCLQANPDALNNEIMRSGFADTLKTAFMSYAGGSLSLLDSVPMVFAGLLEYPASPYPELELSGYENAGKYLVKFETPLFALERPGLNVSLQVFSILDKRRASELKEKETYYLNGVFAGFANEFPLPSERVYTHFPSVVSTSEGCSVSLGTLVFDSLTCARARTDT